METETERRRGRIGGEKTEIGLATLKSFKLTLLDGEDEEREMLEVSVDG